jgi:SWI/SNF-related matrix-associated actin-dependent regulator 1 of chromatin subfamily A
LKKFAAPETNGGMCDILSFTCKGELSYLHLSFVIVTTNSVPQKRNADSQGSSSSRAPKQLNSGSGANSTSLSSPAGTRKNSADHKDARVVPGKAVKKIRSDFEGRDRLASLSKKRGADFEDLEVVSSKAAKQLKQTRPERANAVQDITLESIDDPATCQKIIRMRAVIPSLTVLNCKQALEAKKGNYDDAMDLLSSKKGRRQVVDMITISDDEDDGGRSADKPHVAAVPTTKREVKAPNRTIQDKWSSTQALPKLPQSPTQSLPATPTKPKKRLVRGTGMQPSPTLESAKASPVRPKSPEPWDDSDSAAEISSEDDALLQTKVLHFFNSCSIKDLADISNQPEDIAAVIVAHRPFANLGQVRRVSNETSSTTKAGKRRTQKKAIGDKIVDICLDMWTGYEAVDDLVTRCEALGAPVAEEMKKWGVNVYGAAKDGELEIVALDNLTNDDKTTSDIAAQQSVQDSGIGTPSTRAPTPAEDEVRSRTARREVARRKAKLNGLLGQPAIMNPEITLKDYQLVGLNWLTLLYNKGLSCILADDMGLGKTCQVIAFLSHLLERGVKGPHLVVVPGSTLENWLREFRAFSPSLVVEPYYGKPMLR